MVSGRKSVERARSVDLLPIVCVSLGGFIFFVVLVGRPSIWKLRATGKSLLCENPAMLFICGKADVSTVLGQTKRFLRGWEIYVGDKSTKRWFKLGILFPKIFRPHWEALFKGYL